MMVWCVEILLLLFRKKRGNAETGEGRPARDGRREEGRPAEVFIVVKVIEISCFEFGCNVGGILGERVRMVKV